MTLDEIRRQLETAETLPAEALAAAAADAGALAPDVIGLMRKAVDGVYLIPRQENLVFFGARALAAARETSVYPALTALLTQPEHRLERLLGHNLVGLLLGLYDGNPDPLFAAIEHADTGGRIKWRLFRTLARLTFEGRVPRERMIDLIDRFERDAMAAPGNAAWEGWLEAVMYLGLRQFEQRALAMGRGAWQQEEARRDWLSRLERAAAHPEDPQRFNDDGVMAITDPVASLSWMAETEETEETPQAAEEESEDPAASIALTDDELRWLAGFLGSAQAPALTMNLEMLDGFFTALVIGPETIKPSEYLPLVWGEGDSAPAFDSLEQAQFVTNLLVRHWTTMVQRLEAGCLPALVMFDDAPENNGREWVKGFVRGMMLRLDAWTPLVRDHKVGPLLASIVALIGHEYSKDFKELTPELRNDTGELLPYSLMAIYLFWRGRGRRSVPAEPARSTKVGRNEPCPCGSGRKYKRCCGANADRMKVA